MNTPVNRLTISLERKGDWKVPEYLSEKTLIMTQSFEKAILEIRKLLDEKQDAIAVVIMAELKSERQWDNAFENSKAELDQLAEEALKQYSDNKTEPLDTKLAANLQVNAATVAAGVGFDNARQIHRLQPSLGNRLVVEFGDKAEGGLRYATIDALDLVECIGRHIRAIGVIQHVGILVPAQQGVPIGVGHMGRRCRRGVCRWTEWILREGDMVPVKPKQIGLGSSTSPSFCRHRRRDDEDTLDRR